MSFVGDQLYKGYLRRNMSTIVSRVKVREIMPHLPCLTDHDRETIEAKREISGNYNGMMLLLECLKRRENWPEQFIAALEACDHPTIAAEIREQYNALKGINNSSPPTTVIKVHVHPTPSASHLSDPESGGNSRAAVAPPAEASAAQASPPVEVPVQPRAPQSSAAQVPEAVPPPEPVAEPAQIKVAPAPSTPPPSPETPHTQATTTPPSQREMNYHQEPVENSESDIQGISGDNGVIPDPVRAGSNEVTIDSPQPSRPVQTDTRQTTTTTEVRPPQSPPPAQMNSDVSDGSSFPIMTPEKPPVQDTTPPGDIKPAAVLQAEESSEPPATQVVESRPRTENAATTSPLPRAAEIDASLSDDDSVLLSKPGQLVSVHPQDHGSPALYAPSSPTEPYSGDSGRLEMSNAAPETVTPVHVPACSAVRPITLSTVTALPCQENGIAFNHNEPEENNYESPCQSLESQDVRMNVVQISEEVSILNLDGQSVNGEAAKEIAPSNDADSVSSVYPPSSENHHPSEPAPELKTLQDSEEKISFPTLPANTKYILTAAGVGACALLMAWKLKN